MIRDKSINNISFAFLSKSSDFLNVVLNNISECVILLNERMELQAFNDSLKTIFSNKKDEHIMYQRCGEVINCAYTIDEQKDCGTTSQCSSCELRIAAMEAYVNNKNVYKERLDRPFYDNDGNKVMKHLQFSIKTFKFDQEKYLLVTIEDITQLVETKEELMELKNAAYGSISND